MRAWDEGRDVHMQVSVCSVSMRDWSVEWRQGSTMEKNLQAYDKVRVCRKGGAGVKRKYGECVGRSRR